MKLSGEDFCFYSLITQNAKNRTYVPDQIVYMDLNINTNLDKNLRKYINIDYVKSISINNLIVVILESPHKDEFINPKGPLKHSWDDFCTYFISEFKKTKIYNILDKSINYNLIFINAVPFQCSEGKDLTDEKNRKLKNNNLLKCWGNGFNKNLFERINFINPILIVNLCTSTLKNEINSILRENKINFICGIHPSGWNDEKNKDINCQLIWNM